MADFHEESAIVRRLAFLGEQSFPHRARCFVWLLFGRDGESFLDRGHVPQGIPSIG